MRDPTLNKSDDGAMLRGPIINSAFKERWSLEVRDVDTSDGEDLGTQPKKIPADRYSGEE
jgi:hypothetical protein